MKRPPFAWHKVTKKLLRHYPNVAHLSQAIVSVSLQQIFLIDRLTLVGAFPVSTSRFGTGTMQNSFRTPLGAHCVVLKIGADRPLLTRFVGRRAQGKADLNTLNCIGDNDTICTRILWLTGLQQGYNKGGFFDSMRRYIYIHGTTDEKRIGVPSSLGCIRMRNHDVCKVFEVLQQGSLVYIL